MSRKNALVVSEFVAAWLSAHCGKWISSARQMHGDINDGSRHYLGRGEETFLDGLGWHTISATRHGHMLDFEFHYADTLFTTDCADGTVSLFILRRIPHSLLAAAKEDAGAILGSSEISFPQMKLRSASTTKGITSLVFDVGNFSL